jgi:3-phosphoshikimate 1-carboxyvinyltransferase
MENAVSRIVSADGSYREGAFFLARAALGEKLTIKGLPAISGEAEREIVSLLTRMGCDILVVEETNSLSLELKAPRRLRALTENISEYPQLAPLLAVLGAVAAGMTVLEADSEDIAEAARFALIQQELTKRGAQVAVRENKLFIQGVTELEPFDIYYGDPLIERALKLTPLITAEMY